MCLFSQLLIGSLLYSLPNCERINTASSGYKIEQQVRRLYFSIDRQYERYHKGGLRWWSDECVQYEYEPFVYTVVTVFCVRVRDRL